MGVGVEKMWGELVVDEAVETLMGHIGLPQGDILNEGLGESNSEPRGGGGSMKTGGNGCISLGVLE